MNIASPWYSVGYPPVYFRKQKLPYMIICNLYHDYTNWKFAVVSELTKCFGHEVIIIASSLEEAKEKSDNILKNIGWKLLNDREMNLL